MNHTTNYNLPQWEDSDRVTRGDMNTAMASIDAALGNGAKIAVGNYRGKGTYGTESRNSLTFDFTPKLVLLYYDARIMTLDQATPIYWGVTYSTDFFADNATRRIFMSFSGNTMSWYSLVSAPYQFNASGTRYYYLAIG